MYESRIGEFRVKVALRKKRRLDTQIAKKRGWISPPEKRRRGQNNMLKLLSPLHVRENCCLVAEPELWVGARFAFHQF
jgi:hypothetical protein